MARHYRRGHIVGRKIRRIRSSGSKGLLNWLEKNWWLLPALIIIFGALAWVDPSSSPTSIPFNPVQATVGSAPAPANCNVCKDQNKGCDCKKGKCNSQCGNSIVCDIASLQPCVNSGVVPTKIAQQFNKNPTAQFLQCLLAGSCNPGELK